MTPIMAWFHPSNTADEAAPESHHPLATEQIAATYRREKKSPVPAAIATQW
ncbi:hypothetical protein [Rhodococcus sp. NBC_00297]|uniref:hypothetical protein n=1 Tax=Rhodococcus sp. NBC_00297 TaxID=2976005 RepID=UPI002E2C9D95|nr:hypothetical protein [Rhodococcus sp. NBC_00297]